MPHIYATIKIDDHWRKFDLCLVQIYHQIKTLDCLHHCFSRRRHFEYESGTYTIPKAEKVYVSPDSQLNTAPFRHSGMANDQRRLKDHSTSGYTGKYQGLPAVVDSTDQKAVQEHDYHCVISSPPSSQQTGVDRRGYAHVWERPLPAPESQHSC